MIYFLIFSAFLLSCSDNPHFESNPDDRLSSRSKLMLAPSALYQNNSIETKLTKEGHFEFSTEDLTETRQFILDRLKFYKGYISSDKEYTSSKRISRTLVVKVSSDNFEHFFDDAEAYSNHFDRKDINIRDVTEEYIDINAHLKNQKALEKKYVSLLKKATDILEVLEIEKQLGELRSKIESTEGRLKYLDNKIHFSTITLTYYKTILADKPMTFFFYHSFKEGWLNLVKFVDFLVRYWPFLLLFIGFFYYLYRLYISFRANNS